MSGVLHTKKNEGKYFFFEVAVTDWEDCSFKKKAVKSEDTIRGLCSLKYVTQYRIEFTLEVSTFCHNAVLSTQVF